MDLNLEIDIETDEKPFKTQQVSITKQTQCRSCLTFSSTSYSLDFLACEGSTYKELFERSLGYDIRPCEPQNFCYSCAQKLLLWQEFKEMCDKNQKILLEKFDDLEKNTEIEENRDEERILQESYKTNPSLLVEKEPEISIKQEIKEKEKKNDESESSGSESECSSDDFESDWSAEKDKPASKKRKIVQKPKNIDRQEHVELTFPTYIRRYNSENIKNCEFVGNFTIEGNFEELYQQIYSIIKSFIRGEIIFCAKTGVPSWSPKITLHEKRFDRFIAFLDSQFGNPCSNPSMRHFLKWQNCPLKLLIYIYGKNIRTQQHFQKCEKLLNIPKTKKKKKESYKKLHDKIICLSDSS
ncbi:uncharacterized protein LOC134831547 [Culicoides brevitarsis]|uniref:uncharacterized protein LOC134831547 n=1 Tax=Culicoides brevitarsis TaxID=469753 RepID=UPI00307B19AF